MAWRGRTFQVAGFSRETGWPRQLYTGPTERDYIPLDKR
jgi:hypothetical protein